MRMIGFATCYSMKWMNEWMDGWMDEWMDEWIEFKIRGAWSNVDFLCLWIDSQDVWMDSQTCE